jgi:hypothetical protein
MVLHRISGLPDMGETILYLSRDQCVSRRVLLGYNMQNSG